jgi:DNA-binding NarL/FixJ family response regulator
MSKRILIADDHDVVRQGVQLVLRARPDWDVIGEAENGIDAVSKTKSLKPDLLILDVSMPGKDGLEVIRDLAHARVSSKILVLTMHESKELAVKVQESGASGYVVKTSAARDLVKAIQDIFDGGTFFPQPSGKTGTGARDAGDKQGNSFRVGLSGLAFAH